MIAKGIMPGRNYTEAQPLTADEMIFKKPELLTPITSKTIEILKNAYPPNARLLQAVNCFVIDRLTWLNKKIQEEPSNVELRQAVIIEARKMYKIIEEFFKSFEQSIATVQSGISAEVASALALDELGFTVVPPDERTHNEDTIHGIDMWGDPMDGKHLFALQIKSSLSAKSPRVVRITSLPGINTPQEDNIDIELERQRVLSSYTNTIARMRNYLDSRPIIEDKSTVGFIIELPSGKDNLMHNQTIGTPSPELANMLYDELDREFYRYQED